MDTILTERLTLRPVTANDARALLRIWSDFNRSEYRIYDMPHPSDLPTVSEKADKWAAYNSSDGIFRSYAVCLDSVMIGYFAVKRNGDECELGYCFDSAYHGKGYASESLRGLLSELKRQNITTVSVGTAIKNFPSVKLLTKNGFELVGLQNHTFHKGDDGDPVYFSGGIFRIKLNDKKR